MGRSTLGDIAGEGNDFILSDLGTKSMLTGNDWEAVTGSRVKEKRKIIGHVVDEDLWKLQRCLVGEMANVCSVHSITLRLQEWGLNGINNSGGKTFLLSFEDDDLYIMLEDLDWSYLKEIFCKIEAWPEKLKRPHRATWVEVTGLPLHCWNGTTMGRIAELWENFESLGENANRIIDCEKATTLISIEHPFRIEEVIEIRIGNDVYGISVRELGLKINDVEEVVLKEGMKDKRSGEDIKTNDVGFGCLSRTEPKNLIWVDLVVGEPLEHKNDSVGASVYQDLKNCNDKAFEEDVGFLGLGEVEVLKPEEESKFIVGQVSNKDEALEAKA
ncbi:hypothetical protein V6N13_134314 [Hibiscus sabdariffa]